MADRTGLGAPAQRGSPGALRIGSLGGVDIMVRSSWLLFAALIAYLFAPKIEASAPGLGPWSYVAGVALAVLLTLSVLLHEVSHAVVARRCGIRVRSITLHFIGGVTAIDGEPRTPRQELAISAVGPVTSLAIGAAALGLTLATPDGLLEYTTQTLAAMNLLIGALNLVPGMPLDGGRVLRAAAWQVTGDPHRATVIAGWAGRAVAVVVLAGPLLLGAAGVETRLVDLVIAVVLGWFLWSAASAAVLSGRLRARLPVLAARALARRAVAVPAELPLAEAVNSAHAARAGAIVVVDPDGRPIGVVNEAAVEATPAERRPWMPVSAVARGLEEGLALSAGLTGEELVLAMRATPATEYLLVEPDGAVYGVLVAADVDAAFRATAGGGRGRS